MPIYETTIRGKRRWVADLGRINGRRIRRFHKRKAEAETDVEAHELQRKQAGDVWLGLTASERLEASQVIALARDRGLTIRKVWDHFVETSKMVEIKSVPLSEAIHLIALSKAGGGCRPIYIQKLKAYLVRFARGREKMLVSSITKEMLNAWLDNRKVKPVTIKSERRWLSTFLSFCIRRGWARENFVDSMEEIRIDKVAPKIFTPREAAKILVWSRRRRPQCLAYLTLGIFAGIRPNELGRLGWDSINMDEGVVIVDAAASKVRSRRIIHLHPTALAWLKIAKKMNSAMPMGEGRKKEMLAAMHKALGIKWHTDIMRHTAASYMVASRVDLAAVSADLGNSPTILLNHYRQLVAKKDAERFWNLKPRESLKPVPKLKTLPKPRRSRA
jgi:integrase